MATIQTADGRVLRTQRPAGVGAMGYGGMPNSFPPLWSSGERYPNELTDSLDSFLVSYEQIYRSQPILAGVIDMIAYRAATLPFEAFDIAPDRSRTPLDRSDSLATLLRRPRPRHSTVHLLAHIFTSMLAHGNAVIAKLRGPDRDVPPLMLWGLDWAKLNAYGEPGGDIEWWSTTQFGMQERYIRAEDTIHIAWPAPSGQQVGVSPLEKLGITLAIEDAAQRYQRSNFKNGNRPANAVVLPEKHSKEALEVTRAGITNLHGGVDRAGKTILLSGGADIKPLSMSPVEAALIEQRRLDREEIAIVFGLSGPSLTDSTNSALGNVAERFRAFYRDVLPPYTTLVAETLEAQLVDPEPAWMNRVVRFEFADKLRGEPKEHAEKLKVEVEGGWRSRNEARYETGLQPDGDPQDPENPANKLTMNVNNQAPLDQGGAASNTPPEGVTSE